MINLETYDTALYKMVHLTSKDKDAISKFVVKNPKGFGLQNYLIKWSLRDEEEGLVRTYLIKDKEDGSIVAYFSLRTGLMTQRSSLFHFDTITGIELANFAVNDSYRDAHDVMPELGRYVFSSFVYPLVCDISRYVGASILYIFSLPEKKLMGHYEKMGFQRLPSKMERFIHRHVKPTYDRGCIFMAQRILQVDR